MDEELSELTRAIGESFRGAVFEFRPWRKLAEDWSHDHCQMCTADLREEPSPDDYTEGYVTFTPSEEKKSRFSIAGLFDGAPEYPEGNASWICPPCFEKYRDQFGWELK